MSRRACRTGTTNIAASVSDSKVLRMVSSEVSVPAAQTCCGQPGYNSGDRKAALALARKVLAEFEACEYVVAPSGS